MHLLDSDVTVDILRELPDALAWLKTISFSLGVPGFVALELVAGCKDKKALVTVQEFLSNFPIVWLTEKDLERALVEYAPLKLSYGIGIMDTLIASTGVGQMLFFAE